MQEEEFYEEEEILEIEEDDTTLEDTDVFKEPEPEPEPQAKQSGTELSVEQAVEMFAKAKANGTGSVKIPNCSINFFSEVYAMARSKHRIMLSYQESTGTIYN